MIRLVVHPDTPQPRFINQAVSVLHDGGVVVYPTDTLYALGCAIDAKQAVSRIYRAKRMRDNQRLAIICPDLSLASRYGQLSDAAHRIARRLLPGPYTLVLPATREVPRMLMDKRGRKVGLRVPDHAITQALVRGLGRPLLTSSAVNPETHEPCVDADEAEAVFGRAVDLIVDGGETGSLPSTVLEINGAEIEVLREGAGSLDVLD